MVLLPRINATKPRRQHWGSRQLLEASACLSKRNSNPAGCECSGESTYDRSIQVNYSYLKLFHISTAANLLAWSLALLLTGQVVPSRITVTRAH